MGPSDQLALEALHPVAELVDHTIDSGERIGAGGVGSNDVAVAVNGDLAHLLVGDTRVLFLLEPDLGPVHPVEDPSDPRQLLLDRGPHVVRYVDVPTPDGDVHAVPPTFDRCRPAA